MSLLSTLLLSATLHAAVPAPVSAEIDHLLGYLESSGCSFQRNGKWHDAARARDHLEDKYEYLAKRDRIARTEDFIALAASASSLSGKPYQVRCGDSPPVNSGIWFKAELQRLRSR